MAKSKLHRQESATGTDARQAERGRILVPGTDMTLIPVPGSALIPKGSFKRRLLIMAGSSSALQVLSTASAVILTPLLISSLKPSGFGQYSTVMTIPTLMTVADLGLASGIVSPLSKALEKSCLLYTSDAADEEDSVDL